MAVYAKKAGEEDKIFSGLSRLMEEDPTIRVEKNVETTESVLSGLGELHLEVIAKKLASKFGAECILQFPKIPYRESIRKKIDVQGRHKKQSGGHGQFGDVWIEFRPQRRPDRHRVPLRGRGRGRRGAAQLHPRGRKGPARQHQARRAGRLPRWWA